MSKLCVEKRVQILSMLCEGMSMRSISRITGASINTVSKLLIDAGHVCLDFHDRNVRNLNCKRVQCDEIWSFCYAKQKNRERAKKPPEFAGDVWTWTAIDAESKLICNWFASTRDAEAADYFIRALASRLNHRVQLTTDGNRVYLDAVKGHFGNDIDYAMLVKLYGSDPDDKEDKSNRIKEDGIKTVTCTGNPDPDHISTSFIERQNLTMRMSMRRFSRKTNAHSKKYENHCHALALYFVYYNFIRNHMTLKTTPAVAAGIVDEAYTMNLIVQLIEKRAPKVGRPVKAV